MQQISMQVAIRKRSISSRDLINFNKAKHNRLLIFSTITIWAPLIVVGIRTLSPGIFKNAVDIEILTSASTSDSSGINKSGLMLVLRKMRDTYIKYIPENLRVIIKWLFRILLIIFIIFNLLGFEGVFNILSNNYYIKLFCYISCSLSICYEMLNLYMLHRFINKNINISSVLPDYIIELLKELENISSDIESIKYFKKTCYIHILLYIIPIIMVTLIF